MRHGEVVDVYVVADTGAGPEWDSLCKNRNRCALPRRHLQNDGNQVRLGIVMLAVAVPRAGDIEVTQDGIPYAMNLLEPPQHRFHLELDSPYGFSGAFGEDSTMSGVCGSPNTQRSMRTQSGENTIRGAAFEQIQRARNVVAKIALGYFMESPTIASAAKCIPHQICSLEQIRQCFSIERISNAFCGACDRRRLHEVPRALFRNNVTSSLNLLECCAANRVSRFVFSSTAAVFGDPQTPLIVIFAEGAAKPVWRIEAPSGSDAAVVPANSWRTVCRLALLQCRGAWTATRASRSESHLIPIVCKWRRGSAHLVSVFGKDYPLRTATCVRDYVHIYDLAMAHLLVMGRAEGPRSARLQSWQRQWFQRARSD